MIVVPKPVEDIVAEYRSLVQEQAKAVQIVRGRTDPSTPFVDLDRSTAVLHKTTIHCLFLQALQSKVWLKLDDRDDYIFALYDRWSKDAGPYHFHQLMALVIVSGLAQAKERARKLVVSPIGSVPYLGYPLVSTEDFERDFLTEHGVIVLPTEYLEALLGDGGILRRLDPLIQSSGEEVIGAFYAGAMSHEDTRQAESLARIRAEQNFNRLCQGFNELNPEDQLKRFSGVKIVDPACSSGSVLIHTKRLLFESIKLATAACNVGFDPSLTARYIVRRNLHGLDKDPVAIEAARMRIALEIISHDTRPTPLPDLRQDLEIGDSVSLLPVYYTEHPPLPPEGVTVEYKSTFEWDSRKAGKNPALVQATIKTICAFLNAEGGQLYIGVSDSGQPLGLTGDFSLLKDSAKEDMFENRLREALKNHLEPIPLNLVTISFPIISGVQVAKIDVKPRPRDVTYMLTKDPTTGRLVDEVYVRDGNRTLALNGRRRDQFVISRLGDENI